jgi:hypothetical protein
MNPSGQQQFVPNPNMSGQQFGQPAGQFNYPSGQFQQPGQFGQHPSGQFQQPGQFGQQPTAPPNFGYPTPAGGVQQYPYPQQNQQMMSGEDEWVQVQHGAPLPYGQLIKAMDRQLSNNDHTAKDCYVALWMKNNEPVFGRAWNNGGKVEAWFPHGGNENHSGNAGPFKLLMYRGPPYQNFRYAWIPVQQLSANTMCQPVAQQSYVPIVLRDIRAEKFNGEILGKGDLNRRMAWASYAGKEHHFSGHQFDSAHVLCRVPL